MTQDSTTRRERHAAKRKARILDAAARIFAEKGFHRSTTKDIAEAADVGEGTIFNYFGTKADLLLALLDRLGDLRQHQELYDRANKESLRTALENHLRENLIEEGQFSTLLEALLPELITTPSLAKRYIDEQLKPSLDILESLFQVHVDAGDIQIANITATVRLLAGAYAGLWLLAMLGDDESDALVHDPDVLIQSLIQLVFDGLEKRE